MANERASEPAAGSIYDLGYRSYRGERLGRRHALAVLYLYSLRGVFGIGRSAVSKIVAIGLAIVILVPAIVHLGVGVLTKDTVDVFKAVDYYVVVQIILMLFITAVAPDLLARDQRTRTLSLYFSRALKRKDYAMAKFGALVTAMLVLTVVPQAVMFVGNSMAGNDATGYLKDEWDLVPRILASALLLSLLMAGIGLAIAAQTSRRAYSTVAILATFIVTLPVASILVSTFGSDFARLSVLFSPFHVIRGFTLWIFDVTPGRGGETAIAALPGALYALAAVIITVLTLIVLLRRYDRIRA